MCWSFLCQIAYRNNFTFILYMFFYINYTQSVHDITLEKKVGLENLDEIINAQNDILPVPKSCVAHENHIHKVGDHVRLYFIIPARCCKLVVIIQLIISLSILIIFK